VSRLVRHTERLAVGSGWRAALGSVIRLTLLVLGLYVLARIVRILPSLMWALAACWTIASWRAGKPPKNAPNDPPEEPAPAPDAEPVRTLLLTLMGTGSAVHLRTVLDHLQQHPTTADVTAGWGIADLRVRLELLDIPVHPKVKAGGAGPTRGVRREDLAPSPAETQKSSTEPSTAA
jgi:hypothetical protein